MEVSIPARSVPQIMIGKLETQLPVCVTTKAKKAQYFEYNRSQTKQQKQPPHNNRPKQLLLKASSYLSIGQYVERNQARNKIKNDDVIFYTQSNEIDTTYIIA